LAQLAIQRVPAEPKEHASFYLGDVDMCLSVPARIVSLDGRKAVVDVYSERRQVYLGVDQAAIGDWVLLYGPVALRRLADEEAHETIRLLRGITGKSAKTVG